MSEIAVGDWLNETAAKIHDSRRGSPWPHGLCEDSLEYGATIRGLAQGECVTADLASADRAALEKIVRQLEAAWNAMDGSAFATPFAAEADFVNIRGDHFRGRAAIAAGHAAIFRTIYAGSTNQYTGEGARLLRPEVALVRVHAIMHAPKVRSRGDTAPVSPWS
jgi:uncharacterized protein (TIGR02246 family)